MKFHFHSLSCFGGVSKDLIQQGAGLVHWPENGVWPQSKLSANFKWLKILKLLCENDRRQTKSIPRLLHKSKWMRILKLLCENDSAKTKSIPWLLHNRPLGGFFLPSGKHPLPVQPQPHVTVKARPCHIPGYSFSLARRFHGGERCQYPSHLNCFPYSIAGCFTRRSDRRALCSCAPGYDVSYSFNNYRDWGSVCLRCEGIIQHGIKNRFDGFHGPDLPDRFGRSLASGPAVDFGLSGPRFRSTVGWPSPRQIATYARAIEYWMKKDSENKNYVLQDFIFDNPPPGRLRSCESYLRTVLCGLEPVMERCRYFRRRALGSTSDVNLREMGEMILAIIVWFECDMRYLLHDPRLSQEGHGFLYYLINGLHRLPPWDGEFLYLHAGLIADHEKEEGSVWQLPMRLAMPTNEYGCEVRIKVLSEGSRSRDLSKLPLPYKTCVLLPNFRARVIRGPSCYINLEETSS